MKTKNDNEKKVNKSVFQKFEVSFNAVNAYLFKTTKAFKKIDYPNIMQNEEPLWKNSSAFQDLNVNILNSNNEIQTQVLI